jgi:hypothetical protein
MGRKTGSQAENKAPFSFGRKALVVFRNDISDANLLMIGF